MIIYHIKVYGSEYKSQVIVNKVLLLNTVISEANYSFDVTVLPTLGIYLLSHT